ncbi:MAG: FimV/HubP family polar landmark protein [Pseudomonadales bacterium]
MSRYSLPVIGLSSLLLASQVNALELGNIRVLSGEDEPFKADIELTEVGRLRPIDIAVALANEVEYKQAKVARGEFLQQLSYDVILNGRDGGVIQVSSPVAISQNEWQLLLEARWPSGRRLKQFMVDTDERSFTEGGNGVFVDQQAEVDSPAVESSVATIDPSADSIVTESDESQPSEPEADKSPAMPARPEPEVMAEEAAELVFEEAPGTEAELDGIDASIDEPAPVVAQGDTVSSYTPSAVAQDETYTTERGDVLWRIANRVRPADDVSIYQTLLALQQLNPSAFVNNNVNRLKVGQVLRIPAESDVRSNGGDAARREIIDQIRVWEEEKGAVRQLDARPEASSSNVPKSNSNPSLTLSTSDGSAMLNNSSSDEDIAAMNRQLERALQQLEDAQRNSAELSDEIQEKDQVVSDLRNKLKVLNAQLATLQSRLAEDPNFDPALIDVEEPSIEETDLDENETVSDSSDSDELDFDAAEDPDREFEEVEAQPLEQVDARSSEQDDKSQSSLLDSLMGWKGIAAIAGVIAAIGLLLFARKRREDEDDYIEEEFDLPEERQVPPPQELRQEDDANLALHTEVEDEELLDDASEYDEENNDPLKEADIYFAYGRFPEAAELLNSAILAEPGRVDLLQKLVEVHTAAGNDDAARETLDRLVELQADEFVEPVSEAELDSLDDLDNIDGIDNIGELDDIEEFSTPSEMLLDDTLDLDDTLESTETADLSSVSLVAVKRYNDSFESEDVSNETFSSSEFATPEVLGDTSADFGLTDGDLMDGAEEFAEGEPEHEENAADFEISLQSADQLISDGKPAAARAVLKAMMETGTALQKQQAKEMLLSLD